jgi:hypothetical protein
MIPDSLGARPLLNLEILHHRWPFLVDEIIGRYSNRRTNGRGLRA